MKKLISHLGDTWFEALGNALLLVLVGPVWLFLLGLVLIWGVIRFIFRLPYPKQIPTIVDDDAISPKLKAQKYLEQFKREVKNLKVTDEDDSLLLHTKFADIEIWQHSSMVGIDLIGKDKRLDTDLWHTDEEGNLDIFFWYAVAALRNGVTYRKNTFGRNVGWIYSEEMSIWIGVSTDADKYHSSYTKYARKVS